MARIPDAELERLKREVSVERLVEARGVELRRHGADLIGRCPFHDDREPSLVVTPSKNLWHCMGECQQGGSAIDWVMKAEGVSFRHAVEILRGGEVSALAASPAEPVKRSKTVKLAPLLAFDADDRALLRQVVDYYHEALKQSPEALGYLESRGLRSAEMIDGFKLGFSNRTLGYRLPWKTSESGREMRSRLEKLGLFRESGHEHFTGSVVVPVCDEHGNVTEIYGRKITPGLRKGTPLHLYLPGPHRGVWNAEALVASKEVILCEALFDALTFWCAGYRNVTSSYGVEGFSADHLEALKRHGTERVLIAYDRDDAGDAAAERLADKLIAQGIACYRVQFPRGMDANEYALKVTPAEKSLGLVLRHAVWLGQGTPPVRETEPPVVELVAEQLVSEAARPSEPNAVEPPEPPATSTESATSTVAAEVKPEEVVIRFGDRRYRIRGLAKNLSYEQLRVNVLAGRGESFFVDTLDLYSARQRALFVREAAAELALKEDVIRKDLGKVLLKLEELQDQQIRRALEPKDETVKLSETETAAALELLRDPNILDRILADFERSGVVGEETNLLMGYLSAVSRKLEEPLAVIIQSSSAAGKSSLMDAILAFMPEEERVKYSAMTGQSLFYMGETDLAGKILAIVEEQGAERASYALKLLQSEGELTIASTGKDPATGKHVTHEYRVQGPVMIFLTTTAIEIDEELLNRCLVLTVNEEREQTRAIHRLQRERQTLEGLLARQDRERILKVHRDAQRLLRPLLVANPFARELTFLDTQTRTRRDHVKYLTLIRSLALLHQHQRPTKTIEHTGRSVDYIEVTRQDIATANRLANEVLGRSLDELSPQTRRLLFLVEEMVSEACRRLEVERQDYRFSRRDVRERTGLGNTQLKHHLHRLEELEYVLVHRGGRGQSFVYELLYRGEGKDGKPFLLGIDDSSERDYDGNRSGASSEKSGPGRPLVGVKSGGGRSGENGLSPASDEAPSERIEPSSGNGSLGRRDRSRSSYTPYSGALP